MQLELSQQLFYFDDEKRFFDKDRNIGDGICGMNILKQKMRERNWKDQKKPREDDQKPLKNVAKFFMSGRRKITVQKTN